MSHAKPRGTRKEAKAYQAMQAQAGIAEGLASMVRGQGEPAEKVFARLRQKHGVKPAISQQRG